MLIVVVDTSGLIAEVDRGSEFHEATKSLLDELRADRSARLLVSLFVLAEVDYLVSARLHRPDLAMEILEDVARGAYGLEPFYNEDVARAAEVMRRYADLGVGLTDAANVVLVERHRPAHPRRVPLQGAAWSRGSALPPAPGRPIGQRLYSKRWTAGGMNKSTNYR